MRAGAGTGDNWTLADWEHRLSSRQSHLERFAGTELAGLEPPVRRYLEQAIAPGTPLAGSARLSMRGTIKLGRWLPFRAQQILCPTAGFVWSARVGGIITGSDRYLDGIGEMDFKLGGLLRVAHGEGADVSRSAAGRGGAEAIWIPTAMLPRYGVLWTAEDDTHITARYELHGTWLVVQHTIDLGGRLRSLAFDRWGDPDKTGQWAWHRFGGEITAHRTFGGLTIPSRGRMGWHFGTQRWPSGEFFRFTITGLRQVPDRDLAR